jgi:hypothetical protein
MSFIDKFRELLGLKARHIDSQMSGDAQTAASILKQRADMHLDRVGEDLGRHLDARIAEHKAQFDQVEPLSLDALLPGPASPAGLLAPAKASPAGDAKAEQEKLAAAIVASPAAALPAVPDTNEASAKTPEASAAAPTKKPRAKRSRY